VILAEREDPESFALPSIGRGVAEPRWGGAWMSEKEEESGISEAAWGRSMGELGLDSPVSTV